MTRQPVSIEIPADDTEGGRAFYGSLFGWRFEDMPGPFEYHRTQINDDAGASITDMEPGKRGIRVYLYVDEIRGAVAQVRELGGEAGEPQAVPERGWFALCTDPHGNDFGLYQRDPSAPTPTG